MNKTINLTEGHITEKLIKLALPIMGTSFIQMAYNLIDMIWVGKQGSNAVAAVGTAGFYPWLAMAFIILSKCGCEIKVAQNIGKGDLKEAKNYIKSGIQLNIILSVLYTIVMIAFNKPLIELFRLGNDEVISMSRVYLIIVGFGMVFYFINPIFTSIFNGLGNSRSPFIVNTIGLVANIILDPLLIFGIGPIKGYGVAGAAIATVCAQIVVTIGFIVLAVKNSKFFKLNYFKTAHLNYYKVICKLGFPVAVQNALFTLFSMVIGIIVAAFGPVAIAAQKVGSQIESISWMSADGFAAAISNFVGQNYGAQKYERIDRGCRIGIWVSMLWGVLTTIILIFFSVPIFTIFINEPEAIAKGADYLKILGFSQLFMCLEIVTCSIFKGLGRTYMTSIICIVLTGARIPIAYILSKPDLLGLNGVWWSISISSICKGTLLLSLFMLLFKSNKLYSEYKESVIA